MNRFIWYYENKYIEIGTHKKVIGPWFVFSMDASSEMFCSINIVICFIDIKRFWKS